MKNIAPTSAGIIVLALALCVLPPSASALSSSCEYTGPPAPAKGELFEKVRVMTMNVWGLYDDNELKCEARLTATGEQIANSLPAFDIVGLTEVHPDYYWMPTCNGKKLVKGIQVNGEYTGNKARWGHPETSAKDHDGGTSLFSTTAFDWQPYKEHVHRYTFRRWPRTAHGFIFSRIRISPSVEVDVYVTHIHSTGSGSRKCDQQCKYGELQELAEGIHKRSANSGNPVLVMGDFNIGGPNPTATQCKGNRGYGDIMKVLRNPRDLWLEAHPNQAGATNDSSERIDFIFMPTDPYFTNSPYELVISDPGDVKIIEWEMPGYFDLNQTWITGPFPVSDHYGVEATLELRRRLDWATVLTVID